MKIVVIGYSGSGKSTLAKFLSIELGLPLLYLDTNQYVDNWKLRERNEAMNLILEFMKKDDWVMDGNYYEFFIQQRCKEADEIIFLNFNRWSCFYRAWKRYRLYRGKHRESMMEGCIEKFDFEFMCWILFQGRKQKNKLFNIIHTYSSKSIILKNQKQVDTYMRERGYNI